MLISKIVQFLDTKIWEIRLNDLSPFQAIPVKYLRILLLAGRGFHQDKCPVRASALTYYSILSVVPVLALVFGIAKGFGLEKMIENRLIDLVQEGSWQIEVVDRILTFSGSLLEHTKGGLIAGLGVIFLFWALISILGHFEASLNDIWEVKRSRTYTRKFTDYLAILVVTPILVILSSSVTVVAASQVKLIVQKITLLGAIGPVIFFLLKWLPYISVWFLLTLNYLILPNTRVHVRSAILAGVVAGTLYQGVQWAYIKSQIGLAKYGAIYGSFAALPLFLVWLQLSWMIVLFGAEIAFSHENVVTYGFHPDYSRMSISSKKLLTLRIFHLLVKRFSQGEPPFGARQISSALEIPVRLVRQLLSGLIGVGLVAETAREAKRESGFQPGQAIETITVKRALDAFELFGDTHLPERTKAEAEPVAAYLRRISEAIEKSPGNVLLKEV
jgi:membrane protein